MLSAFLGVIALGQMLVIVAGGEGLDLSVGATASFCAVLASQNLQGQDVRFLPVLLMVMLTGVIVGMVNGIGAAYLRIPPLVLTLGVASAVQGLAIVVSNGQPSGSANGFLVTMASGKLGAIPYIVIIWLIIGAGGLFCLRRTKYGRLLYGLGENELVARFSGVNARFLRMLAYVASGLLAALAGLFLLGYTQTPYLDIGSSYSLPSIIAVIMGGVSLKGGEGSYIGVIAGSIILTTVTSILITLKMGEGGRQIVYGLMLLVLLVTYARTEREY
jgi:ribose transport system permease protein